LVHQLAWTQNKLFYGWLERERVCVYIYICIYAIVQILIFSSISIFSKYIYKINHGTVRKLVKFMLFLIHGRQEVVVKITISSIAGK